MRRKSVQRLSPAVPVPLQILPNVQHVIVPPTRQIFPVRGPLQAADFLGVPGNCGYNVLSLSHVVMDNLAAAAAAAQDVRVPGEGGDARRVALHDAQAFHLGAVPELHGAAGRSHGQDVALLDPGEGADVVVALELEELFDVSGACVGLVLSKFCASVVVKLLFLGLLRQILL